MLKYQRVTIISRFIGPIFLWERRGFSPVPERFPMTKITSSMGTSWEIPRKTIQGKPTKWKIYGE